MLLILHLTVLPGVTQGRSHATSRGRAAESKFVLIGHTNSSASRASELMPTVPHAVRNQAVKYGHDPGIKEHEAIRQGKQPGCSRGRCQSQIPCLHDFHSFHPSLAGWPWDSYRTSLSPNCIICKVGIIISTPFSDDYTYYISCCGAWHIISF